jgi:XRE family transcriptional regulator, regulator of sulfur utilization
MTMTSDEPMQSPVVPRAGFEPAPANGVAPALEEPGALRSSLAANVARIRVARGWSLRELALRAEVSKALLSRIERGEGNPSLETLYRIASALGCSISELVALETFEPQIVRAGEAQAIESAEGRMVSRLIFASGSHSRIEIYDCDMAPRARSEWEGRSGYGVTEYAVVVEGPVRVGTPGREETLGAGDAIAFRHDTTNAYESFDVQVRVVCVVAYDA